MTPDPYPDADDPAHAGHEDRSADGPPRWITVLVVGAIVLVILLLVFLHLSGAVGPAAH